MNSRCTDTQDMFNQHKQHAMTNIFNQHFVLDLYIQKVVRIYLSITKNNSPHVARVDHGRGGLVQTARDRRSVVFIEPIQLLEIPFFYIRANFRGQTHIYPPKTRVTHGAMFFSADFAKR